MLDSGQQWQLFGYDVRDLGRHWAGAWRDLLWAEDSPVRRRLDEVVRLRSEEGATLYQAGRISPDAPCDCEAVLLPEELVLCRRLRLPVSAEAYLDSALALEVNANSPFLPDDTAHGWRITGRDDSRLDIALVVVSVSAVMTYLARQYDSHDPRAQEVWARLEEGLVLLRGFGEHRRERMYRKRLLRCGAGITAVAALLLVIAAVSALSKRAELARFEETAADIGRQAAEATQLRASVTRANETIVAVNEVLQNFPSPHLEIARLTALLEDDVSINQFQMSGRQIRLRGRAVDAASVMQKLTDEADYGEVSAPQAIVKVGNTGLEQFSLNINLRPGESG